MTARLAQIGFHYAKRDAEGDYTYTGTMMGTDAGIVAQITPTHRLARPTVVLLTPDEEARPVYREMKATLIKKYGSPTVTVERFDPPYEDGDGSEELTMRHDHAHFVAFWGSRDEQERAERLAVQTTPKLVVMITYEGPDWGAELARRRATGTSVF